MGCLRYISIPLAKFPLIFVERRFFLQIDRNRCASTLKYNSYINIFDLTQLYITGLHKEECPYQGFLSFRIWFREVTPAARMDIIMGI